MTKYIRYRSGSSTGSAILDGETVRPIAGGLFESHTETGASLDLSGVSLLAPCLPGKILAVGLNYKSHLGGRPQPAHPEIFFKAPTSLQDPGGPIVTPRGATDLHYEGELVIVIGKPVKNASVEEARAAIFGVTCGNDVSERNWQHGPGKDLQWWRAKGCDIILEGDRVFVNKLAYDLKVPFTTRHLAQWSNPRRGDIVVFFSPHDGIRLVKRVVGLPGDKIELRNDSLVLNGLPVQYRPIAEELCAALRPRIARARFMPRNSSPASAMPWPPFRRCRRCEISAPMSCRQGGPS